VTSLYVVARPDPAGGSRWLEVIALGRGQVALSTGVVHAEGARAGELTDRLRAAGRSCAERNLTPAEALSTLDGEVRSAATGAEATAVHAVHDSAARSFELANAGRWPPAIVTPLGATGLIAAASGPPLGADSRVDASVSIPFPLGSTLVLCLHAATCLAGRTLEELLVTRIAEARLATRGRGSAGRVCGVLAGSLGCGDAGHATTVVIAQAREDGYPNHPAQCFAPQPASAGAARAFTLRVMDEWGLVDKANRAAVIVGELAANVIQHTATPFEVRLHRTPWGVLIEVSDRDGHPPDPTPAGPYDAGHRGLSIVETLADRWGTRAIERGKVVWAELQLGSRPHDQGLDPPP
jgi:anti-sigma regulatory factor (Ser/Thr protein kinase)